MSDRIQKTLQPGYMKEFHCIGGACEHNCCIGWNIDVDQKTYERYMRHKDGDLGALMGNVVVKNPAEKIKPQKYACIHLREDGLCPFLNDKMMCRLQAEMGEKYLSVVCSSYPRITNMVNNVLERSATLSCPEAARLVLLNEEPMQFEEGVETESDRLAINTNFSSEDRRWRGTPQELFWEFRFFSIALLQNRDYRIWERLIMLGMFIQEIQNQIDAKAGQESLMETITTYCEHLQSGVFKNGLADFPLKVSSKVLLVRELFEIRLKMGKVDDGFSGIYQSLLSGLNYSNAAKEEELSGVYQSAFKQYYQPFVEEHEYILENYLVNIAFSVLFPFPAGNFFHEYMKLVIQYSAVNTLLIGLCANSVSLSRETMAEVIRSITHSINHHPTYLNTMVNQMRAMGQDNMPHMVILIKN